MGLRRTTWWSLRAAPCLLLIRGGLNGSHWPITVTGADTFTLNGTNATAVGTYAAGGTVYRLATSVNSTVIPYGAGITGRILIQIVDADGNEFDVTQQILSMGVTEGEPNSIVQLQRPLWAAFTQGSRDASGGGNQNLTDILNNTTIGADGEIAIGATQSSLNANGYLTGIADDLPAAQRSDTPPTNSMATLMSGAPPGLIGQVGTPSYQSMSITCAKATSRPPSVRTLSTSAA